MEPDTSGLIWRNDVGEFTIVIAVHDGAQLLFSFDSVIVPTKEAFKSAQTRAYFGPIVVKVFVFVTVIVPPLALIGAIVEVTAFVTPELWSVSSSY
jgi:hypothetical protein